MSKNPVIMQTKRLVGKSITLRNVTLEDAEFIVSLRTDMQKGKFLSPTSNDVEQQRKWIGNYLRGEGQAYFIITDLENKPYGTVRMYDQQGRSFCWGSWILTKAAPSNYAIESALLIYLYALNLGFESAHFDVRKGNASVIKFHERFGATLINETADDYYYEISKENILQSLEKFKKYMPDNLSFK